MSEKPNKALIPLEEIKIRREQLHEGHDNDRDERDERTLNDFDEMIMKLREELPKCKEDFTVEPAAMDEKKWYVVSSVLNSRHTITGLRCVGR